MSDKTSDAVKDSDHLQLIALEYAQCIDKNEDIQACLPQRVVENISTDTALKSFYGPLPSPSQRGDIQVRRIIWKILQFLTRKIEVHQSILVIEAAIRSIDLSNPDFGLRNRASRLIHWATDAILPAGSWFI